MRVLRRLSVLAFVMCLAACAPTAGLPVANPTPSVLPTATVSTEPPTPWTSPVPSPMPSPIALNGTWLLSEFILSGLPTSDACDQYVVTLEWAQGQVRWRRFTGASLVEEEATGALEGDRLVLQGTTLVGLVSEPVTYDLAFDRNTGSLQGTRGNRAVRLTRDETRACQTRMPTVVVRGWVYDEQGRPVPGATVTFRGLNPSNPFVLSVVATNGSYVAYRVPTGETMIVEAASPGRRPQSRERAFLFSRPPIENRLHFGGAATTEDADAPLYPLAPDPSPSPAG